MNQFEIEQTRLRYVRVTNGLDQPFTDRYDGVPVVILPGKSENIPIDMAAHFFSPAFEDPETMFRHVTKRQGWNTPEYLKDCGDGTGRSRAREIFDAIKIEPVTYKLVPEITPDPREPVPAEQEIRQDPAPRRGPGRPPKNAQVEAS